MKITIVSNVSFSGKVLLTGETHDIPESFAKDFIARKIAFCPDLIDAPVESTVDEAVRQIGQQPEAMDPFVTEPVLRVPVATKRGRR